MLPDGGPAIVGVMARAPSSGGKTRLLGRLGDGDGAGLRRALLADTLAAITPIDAAKAILFTPVDAEAEMRAAAPFDALFLAQRGETLGDRMRHAFGDLAARGFARVVLVGADLPTLPARHVSDALARLSRAHRAVVIGPSEDGGYYLIGQRGVTGEIFEGIPWGAPDVLARTLARTAAQDIAVELLPPWYDVDEPADLRRLWSEDSAVVAVHTRAWIRAAPPSVRASLESEAP